MSSMYASPQTTSDIAIEFLQDQSIVTFTDEGEANIDLFYKFQNFTNIQNCRHLNFFQQIKSLTESDTVEIQNPFHSYDESTGIGNYTIGPFNGSFIGNYTLVFKKSSSSEPLELASIKISTFHVQEVNVIQLSNGSTRIECGFAINSDANGCSVVFIDTRSLQNVTVFILKTSYNEDDNTAMMITDIPVGEYYASVYDVVNGVIQASTPAVTLDITISGSEISDDPVLTVLPYMSTPSNGFNSDILIDATPSIPPTVTVTESSSIHYLVVLSASIVLILVLLMIVLLSSVIVIKWFKQSAKRQLTLNSEAEPHIYSELPTHHVASSSVFTVVHTPAMVETAINDHEEESEFLVIPQQPTTSHYENVNVLIPQEEMTRVQDSQHEDGNSIQSSMINKETALPIQSSDLVIEPDAHSGPPVSHVYVSLSTQRSSNNDDDDYLQQSNDSYDENDDNIWSSINEEKAAIHSSELVTNPQATNEELSEYSHCSNVNQFDNDPGKDDLPGYLITNVQLLMSLLSNLTMKENEKLYTTGIFEEAYLSQKFEENELNGEELLKTLEIGKIVACVGDKKYFIPSVLSPKPDGTHIPFEMYCCPLVIKCDIPLPQDLFYHSIVINLLSSIVNDNYEFEVCSDVNQWRNEIQIKEVTAGKISGIIKLTNKDEWIEISTTTANTMENCPNIYEAVDKVFTNSLGRFNYAGLDQPIVTTLCPLCPSTEEDHLSILSMADNTVTCSIDSSKTGRVTEEISCWFEEQETLPTSEQSNFVPINLSPSIGVGLHQPFIQLNHDDADTTDHGDYVDEENYDFSNASYNDAETIDHDYTDEGSYDFANASLPSLNIM